MKTLYKTTLTIAIIFASSAASARTAEDNLHLIAANNQLITAINAKVDAKQSMIIANQSGLTDLDKRVTHNEEEFKTFSHDYDVLANGQHILDERTQEELKRIEKTKTKRLFS